MPARIDNLTWDFILAVIVTDCQILFFVWYEVFYKTGDSLLSTFLGIGMGVAIALAVAIVVFSHVEVIRVISDRYRMKQFNAGREEGLKSGKKIGKEEALKRVKEVLEQSGVELTPEVKARLFGELSEG